MNMDDTYTFILMVAWTAYIFRLGRSYCQRNHVDEE